MIQSSDITDTADDLQKVVDEMRAWACCGWPERAARAEHELTLARSTKEVTLSHAADVMIAEAEAESVENLRTHTVKRGDETWQITVRRVKGKTAEEIIHELRAEILALRCPRFSDKVQ